MSNEIIFFNLFIRPPSWSNNIDEKINLYTQNLPILEDDSKNIVEYIEQTNDKKKKKFNFWKLLEND